MNRPTGSAPYPDDDVAVAEARQADLDVLRRLAVELWEENQHALGRLYARLDVAKSWSDPPKGELAQLWNVADTDEELDVLNRLAVRAGLDDADGGAR